MKIKEFTIGYESNAKDINRVIGGLDTEKELIEEIKIAMDEGATTITIYC